MESIDKILNEIEKNEKINRYKELETIINNDEDIKKLLDEAKRIQKELVHAKSFNKTNVHDKLTKEYDDIMQNLENIPLFMEYLDLQKEINDFLQVTADYIHKSLMLDLSDIWFLIKIIYLLNFNKNYNIFI